MNFANNLQITLLVQITFKSTLSAESFTDISIMFYFLFILYGIMISEGQNECQWPGLDLSNLYDLSNFIECNFTTDGIEEYGMLYSVCRNAPISEYNQSCHSITNDPAMIIQTNVDNGDCADIAYWEYDNEPTHIKTNNDTELWTFKYSNGQKSGWACYDIGRYINITFICDPNAVPYDPLNVECGEPDRCNYYINIKTMDACSTEINQCYWYSDDGEYILNLTDVKGDIISGIDNNSEFLYAYTPCINGLTCNQNDDNKYLMKQLINNQSLNKKVYEELDVMAYRANISSLTCMEYLATWGNGINAPNYDIDNEVWEFVYRIDDICNGLPSIFVVYWYCNINVGLYEVINSTEISQCVYEMTIQSKLACNTN